MHTDTKLYGGVPKPTTVGRGIRVYDRRKDSTAGGVGPQRWNDPSTWTYSTNPYAHATTFLLGYYEYSEAGEWVRVGGCGLTPDVIDWPSYIEGMNIADANGWKISGNIHTGMNKWAVLSSMLQAGGGLPLHKGAMISCSVMSPKVSVATITDNDLLVQGTIDAGALKRERFNTGIPRIRSEAAFWQVAPLAEKTNNTYRIEDGKRIAKEVSFDLVAGGADAATQAGQLTAYAVAENREGIQITVTVGPKFADVRAGSAVTANTPSLGVVGQKMVVVRRRFDPRRFMWTLTLRSETDAKHGWALGQTTAEPATPVLNDTDGMTVPAPNATDWVVSAPNAGNNRLPFIRVSLNPALDGTPTDRNAVAIIIDYRPVDGAGNALGEWASAEYPINAIIDHPVQALTRYQVKLRYRYPRNQQDPAVTTASVYATSSAAVVDDVAPGGGVPPADVTGVPGLSISTVIQPDGTQISRLSASCVAVDGAASYVVQIDNGTTAWTEAVAGPAATNLVVPTGPTYKVRFKAVSRTGVQSANWSAYSASQVSTGDFTGPGAITNVYAAPMPRRVILSWTKPTDPDYSHIRVFRNTTGTGPNVEAAAYQEQIFGTVFPDTNVTAGTTYYYWGMSIDRSGNRGPLVYMGAAQPTYISRGDDYAFSDPNIVTEVGQSLTVFSQSPWVTDTSRTPGQLAAAIETTGFVKSGFKGRDVNLTVSYLFSTITGTQVAKNPEFVGGSMVGWGLYDNSGGGKTSVSLTYSSDTPNASKYRLRISYNGTGTPGDNPQPGYGGFVQSLDDGGVVNAGPGKYRRGSKVLMRITANIPVGYELQFHTNSLGDGGGIQWLSQNAGTGGWYTYVALYTFGAAGAFGNTGYFAVHGGPNVAFDWYVCKLDQLDISSAQASYLAGLRADDGAPQTSAALITSQGQAQTIAGQGFFATESHIEWQAGRIIGNGRPADFAGSSLVLIPLDGTVVLQGNGFYRTDAGATDWSQGAVISQEVFNGPCFVSVRKRNVAAYSMFGLQTAEEAYGGGFADIDFNIYTIGGAGTYWEQWRDGVAVSGHDSNGLDDVYTVAYDGEHIRAYLNGQAVGPALYVGPGKRYRAKFVSATSGSGAGYRDIQIGTYNPTSVAPVTLYADTNFYNLEGNVVRKLPTANYAWDGNVYSREGFRNSCSISFKMGGTGECFAGLASTRGYNASNSYGFIDFGVYMAGDNRAVGAVAGYSVYKAGYGFITIGNYPRDAVWRIDYDGSTVKFFVNDVLAHSTPVDYGRTFYAAACNAGAYTIVDSILFTSGAQVGRLGYNVFDEAGSTSYGSPQLVTSQGQANTVFGQSGWVTTSVPLTRLNRIRDNGRAVNSYQASNGVLTSAALTRSPVFILGSSVQSGAARVSISAHTITGSGVTASYSAGTIDGLAYNTVYYIWAYDPDIVGGAVTYVATSDPNAYINNADYLFLDSITTVQSSGDTGVPPVPPRPPGYSDCVVLDAWLPNLKQARDIRAGDALLMLRPDGEGMEPGTVEGWRIGLAPVMRFETVSGIRLTCSTTTPIPHLVDGEVKYKNAWECTGEEVMAVVDGEGFRWEKLAKQPGHIGEMAVALISAHNGVYAAGDQRDRFIFTHNIMWKRDTMYVEP